MHGVVTMPLQRLSLNGYIYNLCEHFAFEWTVTLIDSPWSLLNLCMQGSQWTVVATVGISKVTNPHQSQPSITKAE